MHIPQSTYRVQLNHLFDFKKLKEIIPYLAKLGITEVYASPIFKARAQSLHGYDVVDPNCINPELGSVEDFDDVLLQLKKYGMTWMQDIVPNHMALDSQNTMLMDIFENGADSDYTGVFDIDWNHSYENMKGRLLVPVLGKFYAQALEDGEIQLSYDEQGFKINYYQFHFPLNVGSYVQVLGHDMKELERQLVHNSDLIKLLGVINLFKALASQVGDISQSEQMRHAKTMLWQMYNQNSSVKDFINGNLAFFNNTNSKDHNFDPLDDLISQQLFRLSFWKVATEEINYRRFFTVSELISVRVEEEAVFNLTHKLILSLVKENKIQSLRVDHVDGLYDPENYLQRLSSQAADCYVVVEKILFPQEEMPRQWLTSGTTGYDFMNYVNGLFCQQDNKNEFERIYQTFTHMPGGYEDVLADKKRVIISKHLAGNIDNLAHQIKNISSKDREGRDITLYGLRRALVEVMAHFPVYRTYINSESVADYDVKYIKEAIEKAKEKIPGFFYELNFIQKFLLLQYGGCATDEDKVAWLNFVMNFQQYTSPVMAKGFEDTMLYVYNQLISLNEVGSSPQKFGFSREEFHAFNARKAVAMPHTMNATATHDVKRGEDVRARINVLSEIPQEWENCLKKWAELNKSKKTKVGKGFAPDDNDEYFLYQTLLGTYPVEKHQDAYVGRVKDCIIKSIREAKRHTAWIKPAEDYEQACLRFIEDLLNPSEDNEFLKLFVPFQKKIAAYGVWNSLAQTVLKITTPGVADVYQGAEFWDLSMVDPDNRRAVDFDKRRRDLQMLTEQGQKNLPECLTSLLADRINDRIKLFVVHHLLRARQVERELFEQGNYAPLTVEGKFKNHVVAFARKLAETAMIVVVPRFLCSVVNQGQLPLGQSVWEDTKIILPSDLAGTYRDVLTQQPLTVQSSVEAGTLLSVFPTAVLISKQ
jgi:(1->4)-alpha-D-glucan 1-alpha-D-glucosylmutase